MAQTTLKNYSNNLFSNHFLEERIQEMPEWKETEIEDEYQHLLDKYEENKRYLSGNPNESRTWKNIIKPLIRLLNHHPEPEPEHESGLNPDFTLFTNGNEFLDAKDDNAEFERAYGILEIKRWERKFDKSTNEGKKDDNSNPAYQTYNYVDRLRVPWGILTDGRKWRLYSYEKCDKKTFFEIDLVDSVILEQDEEKAKRNFKLFYLLFRQEAFTPKGKGFADEVLEGTIKYNKKLKESLKKEVYSAVETACQGFFEFTEQEKTKENRELVHDSALILMYRLLFIMNAESRGLLPIRNQTYQEEYSVQWFQEKIVEKEEISDFKYNTLGWDRLTKLFKGINSSETLDRKHKIPAYNGGLFEHPDDNDEVEPENRFLAENSLPGPFIKEIIKKLGTTEENGELKTVDYRDLDIRHLGSIYEGLLENELQPPAENNKILKDGKWEEASPEEFENIREENRVEKGKVYLANGSGERKATGSYYTPDYIVEYIVENTVGPKIEEKIKSFEESEPEQEKLRKILDLNICDPAMGSGHFLTDATNYIADAVIENIQMEELDIQEDDETNWVKRQVVQNCIYGVDINPLATELAKVSLWIETMAEGKPLNFLDHHLKIGNSLIGSGFNEIFLYPFNEKQKTLQQIDEEKFRFGSPTEQIKKFKEKYEEIESMEEKTVEDIHEKEQKYREFQDNLLYKHFKQVANVHTHQYFENDITQAEYESELLQSVGIPDNTLENEEWYENAERDAEQRNYFHWQLEFPKVFFGEQKGFDAVLGNPPYVFITKIPEIQKSYFEKTYETIHYRFDLYGLFTEKGVNLASEAGEFGYIIPHSILNNNSFGELRKFILENSSEMTAVDFTGPVFEDASNEPMILDIRKGLGFPKLKSALLAPENLDSVGENLIEYSAETFSSLPGKPFLVRGGNWLEKVIEEKVGELESEISAVQGLRTGDNEEFLSEEKDSDKYRKIIRGNNIFQYGHEDSGQYVLYDREELDAPREEFYWEAEKKILVQEVRNVHLKDRIVSCVDDQKHIGLNTTNAVVVNEDSKLDVYSTQALISSSLINNYIRCCFVDNHIATQYLESIPLPKNLESRVNKLAELGEKNTELVREKENINLNIKDYLGNYSDGKTLGEIYSPVEGLSDTILTDTAADRDSLRIGSVEFEEQNGALVLNVSVRYKPENEDKFETDRWGYTETNLVPAMKFNGLREELKILIQEFVPVAVGEAGGFANFRESATKTNSVIYRLDKLTLPKLDDVKQSLEKFVENREEAEELEEEIQETDELIDAIVFDLYDLTEEEVETVLDSLETSNEEKSSILEKFNEVRK